jgi:hypothetical protein
VTTFIDLFAWIVLAIVLLGNGLYLWIACHHVAVVSYKAAAALCSKLLGRKHNFKTYGGHLDAQGGNFAKLSVATVADQRRTKA